MFDGFMPMPSEMYGGPMVQPIAIPLDVTLEELYTGVEKTIDLDEFDDEELRDNGVTGEVSVTIPAGAEDGDKLVIPGRGLQVEEVEEAGDLIVILREEPHNVFQRGPGGELRVKKKLSLVSALTGCTFELEHLDGRKILIQYAG
eukprot:Hpha_TRINITY_DN6797_c0_g1::TRINITY_DN6797_c0_g1_i1::g.110962::m.110962